MPHKVKPEEHHDPISIACNFTSLNRNWFKSKHVENCHYWNILRSNSYCIHLVRNDAGHLCPHASVSHHWPIYWYDCRTFPVVIGPSGPIWKTRRCFPFETSSKRFLVGLFGFAEVLLVVVLISSDRFFFSSEQKHTKTTLPATESLWNQNSCNFSGGLLWRWFVILGKAAACGHLLALLWSGHSRPLAPTFTERPLAATCSHQIALAIKKARIGLCFYDAKAHFSRHRTWKRTRFSKIWHLWSFQ